MKARIDNTHRAGRQFRLTACGRLDYFKPEAASASRSARLGIERSTEDTWRQFSFDLAQGLEVKELKLKHSAETLYQFFGRS